VQLERTGLCGALARTSLQWGTRALRLVEEGEDVSGASLSLGVRFLQSGLTLLIDASTLPHEREEGGECRRKRGEQNGDRQTRETWEDGPSPAIRPHLGALHGAACHKFRKRLESSWCGVPAALAPSSLPSWMSCCFERTPDSPCTPRIQAIGSKLPKARTADRHGVSQGLAGVPGDARHER
jgi:hypothetical protein